VNKAPRKYWTGGRTAENPARSDFPAGFVQYFLQKIHPFFYLCDRSKYRKNKGSAAGIFFVLADL